MDHHRTRPGGMGGYLIPEEEKALNEKDWSKLFNYRGGTRKGTDGRPLPVSAVTKESDFLFCVMNQGLKSSQYAYSFCPYHRGQIRGYEWPIESTPSMFFIIAD